MARQAQIGSMTQGNHAVTAPPGVTLRRSRPNDLMIAHLPFTTPSRFRRKVENIRDFLAKHTTFYDAGMARHWRHWTELLETGRIDEEFNRQVMSLERIAAARASGNVCSAAEMFARRMDGHQELARQL
jgi:hypothetical protein